MGRGPARGVLALRKCGSFDLRKLANHGCSIVYKWTKMASRRCVVRLLVGHERNGVVNSKVQASHVQ